MGLKEYNRKRDFRITSEPAGKRGARETKARRKRPIFVIQEHHARRLHFDFRIESEGVLKSWAVTQEPSTDPSVRRLAVETEDHPLEYAKFHGEIPKGEYGGGQVYIWDTGTYEPIKPVEEGYDSGKVEVMLKGRKLNGPYVLVRTQGEGPRASWLFFKMKPRATGLKFKGKKEKVSDTFFPRPASGARTRTKKAA